MATIDDIEIPSLLFDDQAGDPSTPASGFSRIYTKADGAYHIDDAGTVTGPFAEAGGGPTLDSDRVVRTAADYTITGAGTTTFADVDSSNVTITLTTGARRVLINVTGSATVDNVAGILMFDVTVDSTREGQTAGLFRFHQHATASEEFPINFTHITDVLSAASHTFRLQWRQTNTAHTATLRASAAVTPLIFSAVELL